MKCCGALRDRPDRTLMANWMMAGRMLGPPWHRGGPNIDCGEKRWGTPSSMSCNGYQKSGFRAMQLLDMGVPRSGASRKWRQTGQRHYSVTLWTPMYRSRFQPSVASISSSTFYLHIFITSDALPLVSVGKQGLCVHGNYQPHHRVGLLRLRLQRHGF